MNERKEAAKSDKNKVIQVIMGQNKLMMCTERLASPVLNKLSKILLLVLAKVIAQVFAGNEHHQLLSEL